MKRVLLVLLAFSFFSGHSQKEPFKLYSYSKKYTDDKAKANKGQEPGVVTKWINYNNVNLPHIELPEDWPEGSYRLYLIVNDECKLYFDEKRGVTHMGSNIKFDLTRTQINILNKSLLLTETEHYHDDVLVTDCKDNTFHLPITVSF